VKRRNGGIDMNRNDEYLNLIKELDSNSEKIDNLYKKANKRLIKKHVTAAVTATLSTVASLLILFIILVNNVNSFAYACGSVPILKDLAKFVAMSPSLSAAVEHQYVQPIELSKTQNDITASIEYVIVDQKQVNIFYSLHTEKYKALDTKPEVFDKNNKFLECALSYGDSNETNDLKMITLDFIDKNVPDFISLKLNVKDIGEYFKEAEINDNNTDDVLDSHNRTNEEESEYLTEFEFDIELDPNYTAQGQTLILNKEFEVDGQILVLSTVEIYPTHMRINFADNDKNTKWLKALNFHIKDEKGKIFDKISNGISATGSTDSPMMVSHRLESSFFAKSKELTLFIDEVTWLDKKDNTIKIDLVNNKSDTFSEYYKLHSTKKYLNSWKVEFIVTSTKANHMFNLFNGTYYDDKGNEYYINNSSTTSGLYDDKGDNTLKENQFIQTLYLTDYHEDTVYLEPVFTSIYKVDNPIEIKIK